MAKIKVNELSKTLGIKSAELVELLQKAGSTVKSYASTLSDMDMNIILEHYTKKYDDGSDIYEFMKSLCPKVEEKPKGEEKKEEVIEIKAEPKKEKPNHSNEKRYVDTRANTVDLSKHNDAEKIEELAPEIKDTVTNKQKIKKGQKNKAQNKKETFQPQKHVEKKKEKLP